MSAIARKKWFVPIVLFLLTVIMFSSFSEKENATVNSSETEQRLEELCNLVKGVSNAKVMITYQSRAVSVFGGEKAQNEISGIAIVCDGGDNPRVKLELYKLVDALFNISSTRITVSQRN